MTRYAADTSVSVEKSKAEIERTLQRYGASRFASGWGDGWAFIGFEAEGRQVKFTLELPDQNDEEFRLTPTGKRERSDAQAFAAWEQACRQRWRALALVIKAKLEAVESGITIFDDEFLAHIVMPGGQTVGQMIHPQIAEAYQTGKLKALLPDLRGKG